MMDVKPRLHDIALMNAPVRRCIFCGSEDLSEEHLIADWVFRAFARSRKPGPLFRGLMRDGNQLHLQGGDPVLTARVVCKACNNGWMSGIDRAAAEALKPLVQGRSTVTLNGDAQAAVAAWIYKSALTFDAFQNGDAGQLVTSRSEFMATRAAPAGCTIYLGPAGQTPFTVEGVPEVAGLALFGVDETELPMNVTLKIETPDGVQVSHLEVPLPGYVIRLGHLHAIISGVRGPIVPTPDQGFACIWPVSEWPANVTSAPP